MVPPVKIGVRAAPQGVIQHFTCKQLPLTARQMVSDVGFNVLSYSCYRYRLSYNVPNTETNQLWYQIEISELNDIPLERLSQRTTYYPKLKMHPNKQELLEAYLLNI